MQDLSNLLPTSTGWMHSGIAVDVQGNIYCAHQDGHALVTISPNDQTQIIPVELAELHGICLTTDENHLGVADPGWRMEQIGSELYEPRWTPGHAVLLNKFTGEFVLEIKQPKISAYENAVWRPTSISINTSIPAGADIWVADGYGENLVHKFDPAGNYLLTINGSDSDLVFDCPHAVISISNNGAPEIFIADRGNHRIAVFSPEGELLRIFGELELDSPSGFAVIDNQIYITELHGGVSQFTLDGLFIKRLESSRLRNHTEPSWPNLPGTNERSILAPKVSDQGFNSPHGICAHAGAIYLTEWFIGGRLVKIEL